MTFLQKFELLKQSVPVSALSVGLYTVDCEMVDMVYSSKNSYFSFDSYKLEDSIYCFESWGKNLVDCSNVSESELMYQSLHCSKCFNCTYLLDCAGCRDSNFSALCIACSDVFGCVALTMKQYCIFNKQYTKEEYFKKVKELKKEDPGRLFEQMIKLKNSMPHPASNQYNNENCLYGDYLYNSKNVYWGLSTYDLENCGYIYVGGLNTKNCWDMYFSGIGSQLCYEMTDCSTNFHCAFLFGSLGNTNCYYSSDLQNCTDCFGCAGLSHKKYCILNNQLTKEQYEKAIKEIKKELGWENKTS